MGVRMYIWPRYALEVDGKRIRLPPKPGAVIALLFAARGGIVSHEELIGAASFDDPEGGPLCADNCLKVGICRVRKLLAGTGAEIINVHNRGYRLLRS